MDETQWVIKRTAHTPYILQEDYLYLGNFIAAWVPIIQSASKFSRLEAEGYLKICLITAADLPYNYSLKERGET